MTTQRFHFPRETRAARLKILLAQPGRTVRLINEGLLMISMADDAAVQDALRQVPVALAQLQITGTLVRVDHATFHIYLEERQS
jgi:hypothetical protein